MLLKWGQTSNYYSGRGLLIDRDLNICKYYRYIKETLYNLFNILCILTFIFQGGYSYYVLPDTVQRWDNYQSDTTHLTSLDLPIDKIT